ncbi:hypothetical protein E4H12_01775 [Candidatus Thorarchaeota archaeon]|nr:MAG: hypothetical protein E4H12_01775 [Candidatus Thorarchaeota archaeon]
MNRFDVMLVILTPAMCLFSVMVLPLLFFIAQSMKLLVSLILVVISIMLTLVLLVKRKYRSSEMFTILLGSIFSLAGYMFSIWTVFLWYNMSAILFELALTGVGVVLSLILLRRRTHRQKIETEMDYVQMGDEDTSISYPQPVRSEGNLGRTLRIWREPILYFVMFMVVGIIGMFIYRPIPAGNDILTNIVMGIGFGVLGACCLIGSGRTKFERK